MSSSMTNNRLVDTLRNYYNVPIEVVQYQGLSYFNMRISATIDVGTEVTSDDIVDIIKGLDKKILEISTAKKLTKQNEESSKEIEELRETNKRLQIERDILKDVLAEKKGE